MTEVFLKLVNMSVSASWFALAVMLFRILFRPAPKWLRSVLWGLVGLRLMLPFSVQSVLSALPRARVIDIEPNVPYAETPVIHSGMAALNRAVNPILSEAFAPAPGASVNPLQIFLPAAAIVWAVGMVLYLIYAAVSAFVLYRRMRTAVLAEGNVYESEHAPSPFVFGLLHPRIYLPYGLSETEKAHVAAHENAHIRRYDHLTAPLGFCLLCVYWFNPVLWAAYILFRRDMELACDERVIRTLAAEERAGYSQALLSCSYVRRRAAVSPLAFCEVGVKQRIKTVLHYRKPTLWVILAAAVVCIVMAVCFLTDPKTEPAGAGKGDRLTLEKVVRLSEKGEELTWSDFEGYSYIETGSGLYIRVYEIDDMFSLSIGGGSPSGEEKPYYILLSANAGDPDGKTYLDIREGGVQDFIDSYADAVPLRGVSFSSAVSPVGYSDKAWSAYDARAVKYLKLARSSVQYLPYIRFTTKEELDVFCADMRTVFDFSSAFMDDGARAYGCNPFDEVTGLFNDSFFEKNDVFLFYLVEPTPANHVRADFVRIYDTTLQIGLGRDVAEGGDTAMQGWLVTVCVEKEALAQISEIEAFVSSESVSADAVEMNPERVYTFKKIGDRLAGALISLYEDGRFRFEFSPASSYIGRGIYREQDERLILDTEDGLYTYVFDVTDNAIVFDAHASSENLWLSGLTDEAVLPEESNS